MKNQKLNYIIINSLNIIKKFNFIVVFCLCFGLTSYSQSYNTALGLRLGEDLGYSLKQRIGKKQTIEVVYSNGILTTNKTLMASFQHHMPLITRRFNVYAGIGFGLNWDEPVNDTGADYEYQKMIPIVIGGEFTIGRFNISTDVIPMYILDKNRTKRFEKISGITIRYVLFKRKKNGIFKKIAFWN